MGRLLHVGPRTEQQMPKRTNVFQKLVFLVKKHAAVGTAVTESKLLRDNITGAEREVDVCIESVVAGHQVTVSIECTDRGRRAGVQWVEEMKAKHERLPTNALVLVSRSGFTKEATLVARSYGMEVISLNAIDANAVERLFGETGSLWSKVFTLTPTKVVIRVAPTRSLSAENVVVLPDNLIYDHNGQEVGSAKQLVGLLLNTEHAVQEFGKLGDESHQGFEIRWEPAADKHGHPFCLQKLEPFVLRPIEYVRVTGSCNFDIAEFRLQHGILGNVRIAWGTGSFRGKEALLVASEDQVGGRKLSITTESTEKGPTTRSSGRAKARAAELRVERTRSVRSTGRAASPALAGRPLRVRPTIAGAEIRITASDASGILALYGFSLARPVMYQCNKQQHIRYKISNPCFPVIKPLLHNILI